MRNVILTSVLFGVSIFLGACSNLESARDESSLSIPDSTTSVSLGDLRVGPLDVVQVEVFGVPELDGSYQVDLGGQMKLPLIGEIDAVGRTPAELSYLLEDRYGDTYLQDPDVNVSIAESVGRRITLDGSVNNPGLYDITGSITLLQAVALGGGPTSSANLRKVVVFRQIEGERRARAFDLVAIRNGSKEDPRVFGNDVIVVDGSNLSEGYQNTLRSIPLLALFLAF